MYTHSRRTKANDRPYSHHFHLSNLASYQFIKFISKNSMIWAPMLLTMASSPCEGRAQESVGSLGWFLCNQLGTKMQTGMENTGLESGGLKKEGNHGGTNSTHSTRAISSLICCRVFSTSSPSHGSPFPDLLDHSRPVPQNSALTYKPSCADLSLFCAG